MILQALVKYYEDLEKTRKDFKARMVHRKNFLWDSIVMRWKNSGYFKFEKRSAGRKKNNIKSAAVICADDGNTIIRCSC